MPEVIESNFNHTAELDTDSDEESDRDVDMIACTVEEHDRRTPVVNHLVDGQEAIRLFSDIFT